MDQAETVCIQRPIQQPIRFDLTWQEIWQGPDYGLIRCWELGREKALTQPELAQRCLEGQLPVLGWKGGHDRLLKKPLKFGSLQYLAQWQGLRGEDLNIHLSEEVTLVCSKTNMRTTFTPDQDKYANSVISTD